MKRGLDDFFANGGTRLDLDGLIVDTLPDSVMDWEQPVPVEIDYGPTIPVDALSGNHARLIHAISHSTQTPTDLSLCASIGIAGAATRGQYYVVYKDWKISTHIQTLQLLTSGGGKTPAYNILLKELHEIEARWFEEFEEDRRTWWTRKKRLEIQKTKAKRDAEKVTASDTAMLALESVELELLKHEEEKPVRKRIILDDATVAAAWGIIDRLKGHAAAISDEGGFLKLVAGRFTDEPIWDPLIKGFDGSPHPIDRKTDDEERIIPRPIFAMSIAAQPAVLEDMGQVRGFKQLGVSARLLVNIPVPVSDEDLDAVPPPIDVTAWWDDTISRLCHTNDGATYKPKAIQLTEGAAEAFREEREWHKRETKAGRFDDMEEWGRKYPGQVLRIAGILHVVENENPTTLPIVASTLQRAIRIMRPMVQHAWIAHSIMFGGYGRSAASDVLEAIRNLEQHRDHSAPLTRNDLYQKLKGRVAYRETSSLDGPLRMLESYGWIRRVKSQARSIRPSEIIYVHPCLRRDADGSGEDVPNNVTHMASPTPDPPDTLTPEDIQEARGLAEDMLSDDQVRADTFASLENPKDNDPVYLTSLRYAVELFEHAQQCGEVA